MTEQQIDRRSRVVYSSEATITTPSITDGTVVVDTIHSKKPYHTDNMDGDSDWIDPSDRNSAFRND